MIEKIKSFLRSSYFIDENNLFTRRISPRCPMWLTLSLIVVAVIIFFILYFTNKLDSLLGMWVVFISALVLLPLIVISVFSSFRKNTEQVVSIECKIPIWFKLIIMLIGANILFLIYLTMGFRYNKNLYIFVIPLIILSGITYYYQRNNRVSLKKIISFLLFGFIIPPALWALISFMALILGGPQ
jgi:hypothetical protein